jgi:hypothetical protein
MVGGTWLAPPLLGFSDSSLSPASCLRSVLSCILGFILYAACCLAFACSLVQLTPTWVVFTSVILAVSERGRSPERATPLTISFLVFLLFFPSNPAAFFTMADEMNTDTPALNTDTGVIDAGVLLQSLNIANNLEGQSFVYDKSKEVAWQAQPADFDTESRLQNRVQMNDMAKADVRKFHDALRDFAGTHMSHHGLSFAYISTDLTNVFSIQQVFSVSSYNSKVRTVMCGALMTEEAHAKFLSLDPFVADLEEYGRYVIHTAPANAVTHHFHHSLTRIKCLFPPEAKILMMRKCEALSSATNLTILLNKLLTTEFVIAPDRLVKANEELENRYIALCSMLTNLKFTVSSAGLVSGPVGFEADLAPLKDKRLQAIFGKPPYFIDYHITLPTEQGNVAFYLRLMRASNKGGRTVDEDDAAAIGAASNPTPASPKPAAAEAPPVQQKRRSGRNNKGSATTAAKDNKTGSSSQTTGGKRLSSMLQAANAVTIQEATSPAARSPPVKSPPMKVARTPFNFGAASTVQRAIAYPPP